MAVLLCSRGPSQKPPSRGLCGRRTASPLCGRGGNAPSSCTSGSRAVGPQPAPRGHDLELPSIRCEPRTTTLSMKDTLQLSTTSCDVPGTVLGTGWRRLFGVVGREESVAVQSALFTAKESGKSPSGLLKLLSSLWSVSRGPLHGPPE